MTTTLTVGAMRYDTTAALFDGAVTVPGYDVEMRTGPVVPDLFARMMRDREFDVSELGMGFYLRTLDEPDPPFVAVPAFPNRVFRHSCVYVNAHSGIETPGDLHGRTIGEFGMYSQDSGVWAKGILSDEFGFRPERCRWVIGGLDAPMAPFDFVPQRRPPGVEVTPEPQHALSDMLERGEIDALFSANVPRCVQEGSPHVRRLFPDHAAVERDWYRRTGLFPMMHTVVVRAEVLAEHPDLAKAAYQGFLDAKDVARDHYLGMGRRLYQVHTMMPWMSALVEDDLALMGEDWWPYGIEGNRAAVETFLRYQHEQGISSRRLAVEDVFVQELLDT
ncbi:4,5-dihydroxyphthalate decarboxylase [Pseudonocardia sp. MH-G8]|uniref:4,5-dihydroxyphthalate decarboxylase n=1 Tax=Pseudonocardia sp. MH-G8 TaxID=1854588 RepID=UPI000BA1191B|nr:4,5-dihydroxyphthalate decarboxylase [Pseudonocardia sp. MH-G8]OZM80148.1 4,5-dihydroxyphthalate decarboxylase [Pseudonocardia sp. MH-G8]